jgi:hypothetical protein
MVKGAKDAIEFNMGSDNPIKITYYFAEKKGKAVYLLAPRIESE